MQMPANEHHPTSTAKRLDEVLEVACRLAGRDAIGSLHVAIDERPTYDQVLHYRRLAEAFGLTLTLEADSLVLRPLPRVESERPTPLPVPAIQRRRSETRSGPASRPAGRWPAVLDWLQSRVAGWIAGF